MKERLCQLLQPDFLLSCTANSTVTILWYNFCPCITYLQFHFTNLKTKTTIVIVLSSIVSCTVEKYSFAEFILYHEVSQCTSLLCTAKCSDVLNPYTADRRDVLENNSPEAQDISRGRGFCTLRPERLPEGEVLHLET